jgi:hypothetical protein
MAEKSVPCHQMGYDVAVEVAAWNHSRYKEISKMWMP